MKPYPMVIPLRIVSLAYALPGVHPGAAAPPQVTGEVVIGQQTKSALSDLSFSPLPEAVYQIEGDVTTITIPSGSCAAVDSSPIQVGDFIVWANHAGKSNDCTASPDKDAVLGYNVKDGRLLDANLNPLCVFETPVSGLMATGYDQVPTIDKDGNVDVHVSPNGTGQGNSRLWKVTPACQTTQLATLTQAGASTPVLADDQSVLTIAGGQLQIRDLNGNVAHTYPLASEATVAASPMIADGVIYVTDTSGALTIIRNSGLQGYGTAAWPRYRHDNHGSGIQSLAAPATIQTFLPLIVPGSLTANPASLHFTTAAASFAAQEVGQHEA